MTQTKIAVSVIIHTKNSATTLESCLKSVSFAKEIIIIDMESVDNTKKIAERFNAQFFSVEDKGYGYADPIRNFGLSKANEGWILVVDSDEEVSDGLREWIEEFLMKNVEKASETTAFKIPRRNFMFGVEIQHTGWWPDYQTRFFKKGKVQWESKVHAVPIVDGKTEELPADRKIAFIHQNYASVEQFVERMNRYTTATAKETQAHSEPFSGKQMIKTYREEFVRRLIEWQGIQDGGVGVSLSFLQATYQLLVALKRAELGKFDGNNTDTASTMEELNQFSSDLRYWYLDWKIKQSTGLTKLFWQMKRKLSQ